MKPISRSEALRRELARYCTGRPCKHGHVGERYVHSRHCVECVVARSRAWTAANPAKVRAHTRAWTAANRNKSRVMSRAWRAANPDHFAALLGASNARLRFPGSVPDDFNVEPTIPFYAEARQLTHETGVPHEVDHIHALCLGGKHVASNLQVITAKANRTKGRIERA
jgi:5-methylcytosine-specific restriction endonuclease McrA